MRCGTKLFTVEYELKDTRCVKEVPARTPVDARKIVRKEIGAEAKILSCRASSQLKNETEVQP